jgi:biopolymer transport protein ExbD
VQLKSRRTARPSIGLTPLIDVVFILLLFFMLASDLDHIYHVDVGTSKSGPAAQEQFSAVLLRVHGDGSYSLVDERIDESDLKLRISTHLERNPGQTVVVQPDGDVRLQSLIDILDHLTALGVRSLTLG